MATEFHIGQRVRFNEKYQSVINSDMATRAGKDKNQVGTEFVVTSVRHVSNPPEGHESTAVISGDPNGWGAWGDYLEIVPTKAHTTTVISTLLSWHDKERIISITSGTGAISMSIRPKPHPFGDLSGSTSLTPEEAEEIAHDLLARVAEIRAAQ